MAGGKFLCITIDTLRADHLGCYGYPRPTSPHLDALAREGILFRRAFSPCAYTQPAHASVMTGKYVPHHSLRYSQGRDVLDRDREVTLAEAMKSRGFCTAAFVSALVLAKRWRLDSGFDVYDDRMTRTEQNRAHELFRSGQETNAAALAWLREHRGRDFFVWLHYFDVHGPYVPLSPYDTFFSPADYGPVPHWLEVVAEGEAGGIPRYQVLTDEQTGCPRRDVRYYLARYDGGIRYVDQVVGQLFGALKKLGLFKDMVIVVTADHGEALGENNVYFFHGLTLTPDQIHVPLLVKMPANTGPAGVSVEVSVSSVDIMPTLLDLVGFDYRSLALDGLPLGWALDRPRLLAQRTIHSDLEGQEALICQGRLFLRPRVPPPAPLSYPYNAALVVREQVIPLW